MLVLSSLFACSDKSPKDTAYDVATAYGSCDSPEDSLVFVFSTVSYARRDGDTVWGFDLDNHESDSNDDEGCYHADLSTPDGTPGIDNALSGLIPALEATEAVALETLIQTAINTGELLLIVEVTGVDDVQNDDCVSVGIYRATGTPLVGTDGFLLDGQSFNLDLSLPSDHVTEMAIQDGRLTAKPLEIQLPVQVLDEFLNIEMYNGGVQLDIHEDGSATGFFGGGIPISFFIDIATLPDVNLPDAVVSLMGAAADLDPDENGDCQQLSVALMVEALPAHLYSNSESPSD